MEEISKLNEKTSPNEHLKIVNELICLSKKDEEIDFIIQHLKNE